MTKMTRKCRIRQIGAVGVCRSVVGWLVGHILATVPSTRYVRPSRHRIKSLILHSDEPTDHPPSHLPVRYRAAAAAS